MKVFDIVKTKNGGIGIITMLDSYGKTASVEFFNTCHAKRDNYNLEKTAWWEECELEVIDSITDIITREMGMNR